MISSVKTLRKKPRPEFLFFGYRGQLDGPCHIVVASNDETIILPALGAFRIFCFCPQTVVEPMLADIDRLSVA
jgi:hypothetical protein